MTTPEPAPDNKTTRGWVTGYERQCRILLGAFPADFRRNRGDDLVTTLVDDAPAAARVSVRTAVNLVAAGTRMRARRAGAERSVGRSMAGGLDLAAVVGLGVQAALAVAVAVFFWEHGRVFYLYLQSYAPDLVVKPTVYWMGAYFRVTWIALAVLSVGAFVAAVRGRFRPAALLGGVATLYPLVVLGASVYHQANLKVKLSCVTGSQFHERACSPAMFRAVWFNFRFTQFASTPAVVALTVAVTALVVVAACRHRHPLPPRTWWWLALAAAVAAVLVAAGEGYQVGVHQYNPLEPLRGGVMTALGWLWVAGVVVGLIWSYLDPRVGWAVTVLSIPFVVYQTTAPKFIYTPLVPLWFHHRTALALAIAAIIVLAVNAATTSRRLRHA